MKNNRDHPGRCNWLGALLQAAADALQLLQRAVLAAGHSLSPLVVYNARVRWTWPPQMVMAQRTTAGQSLTASVLPRRPMPVLIHTYSSCAPTTSLLGSAAVCAARTLRG